MRIRYHIKIFRCNVSYDTLIVIKIENSVSITNGVCLQSFLNGFYYTNLCNVFSIHLPLNGRKIFATGPTRKAQIRVPIPKEPPRMKPITTKETSTIIRITPKFFFNLSEIAMETKSLGPVPASDLITMVIPKARITQPRPFTTILRIKEFIFAKGADKMAVKKSMIGPPKIIQRMVPILI